MATETQGTQSEQNYWIRSSLLTLLEKGFGLLFGLGLAMVLWRQLSKQEMGSWAMFLLIAAFVEMARSGMIQNALMRFIAEYRNDPKALGHIQTTAVVMSLCFSVVSSILLFLCMQMLAIKLDAPQLTVVLPIYFLINFVMIGLFHANYVQQSHFEFRGIFWSTFFYRGVPFAFAVFCSLRQMPVSLRSLAISMLLGAVLGTFASARFAWPFFQHARTFSMEWLKKMMDYGKYVLGNNMSTMIYKNIDKVAVSGILGAETFAIYDAASKITQMVEVPSFSMAAVVFPQSAKASIEQGTAGVKYLYERSVGAILAFILPFIIACLLFAEPIVRILAGEQYTDSAGVLRLTALFGLFLPYAVQFGTILDSTGRPATNFWYTSFTAVLNLVLSYFFVTNFGLYGGAYATLISYVVSFFLMQRLLGKSYQINPINALKYVPQFYVAAWSVLQNKWKGATV
jgi:lipopolysaccharide exporter